MRSNQIVKFRTSRNAVCWETEKWFKIKYSTGSEEEALLQIELNYEIDFDACYV